MRLTRLLTTLLLAGGLVLAPSPSPSPATATAGSVEYGRAWRGDGVLRPGCPDYRFHYRVRPANAHPDSGDDWSVEFFLSDRRGDRLGAVVKDSGVDPKRGHGQLTICRQTTVPGRFTIRGKLSVYEGGMLIDEVRTKPGHFRLRRS